jgi:spermidine/putrescine transport system substrate-binding protein
MNPYSLILHLRPCLLIFLVLGLLMAGCAPVPVQDQLADELIFYNWSDYMPQSVLDAFTAEYGVKVTFLAYDSMDQAVAQLRAGQQYDVVVLEYDALPALITDGLLSEIDYHNVPNFKNISANFRDLAFDPGNEHSIPFGYGTTGLLVRSDLVTAPITRWTDPWDSRYLGKVAARAEPYELIGVALKSLGFPLNSEDPQQLEAALQQLLILNPVLVDDETELAIPTLLNGETVIMIGWADDALQAQKENEAVNYILPEEGTLLWGDSFVIPSNSPHKYTAEVFMNFLLRPEIGAQIVNENHYATANEAAYPLIKSEVINNPLIFPPAETIQKADWYLPLSPGGEKLYAEIWGRFLEERP